MPDQPSDPTSPPSNAKLRAQDLALLREDARRLTVRDRPAADSLWTQLLRPRGAVLCAAGDAAALKTQHELVRATGNRIAAGESDPDLAAALFDGAREELLALTKRLAARNGPIVPVHVAPYPREFLFDEVSLSVNTAAAGGNASLMTIG